MLNKHLFAIDGVFPQAGEWMRSSHHGKVISNSFLITGAGGQIGFPWRGKTGAKRQAASFALWKRGPNWRCRRRAGWKLEAGLFAYFLGGLFVFQIAEPEACDQMYESLARLHSNYYKHKVSGSVFFISPALRLEMTNESE